LASTGELATLTNAALAAPQFVLLQLV